MAFCVFWVFLLFQISISCKHNTHRPKSFWFASVLLSEQGWSTKKKVMRCLKMLVTGNHLNGTFYPKLREGLRLNTTLTRLCLYSEQVSFDSWDTMLTMCDSFWTDEKWIWKASKATKMHHCFSLFFLLFLHHDKLTPHTLVCRCWYSQQ